MEWVWNNLPGKRQICYTPYIRWGEHRPWQRKTIFHPNRKFSALHKNKKNVSSSTSSNLASCAGPPQCSTMFLLHGEYKTRKCAKPPPCQTKNCNMDSLHKMALQQGIFCKRFDPWEKTSKVSHNKSPQSNFAQWKKNYTREKVRAGGKQSAHEDHETSGSSDLIGKINHCSDTVIGIKILENEFNCIKNKLYI